jgi:hypothetical protein
MFTARCSVSGDRYPLDEWESLDVVVPGCPSLGISTMLPMNQKLALEREKHVLRIDVCYAEIGTTKKKKWNLEIYK